MRRTPRSSVHLSRPLFAYTAAVGVFLSLFQWFFAYAQQIVEATLLLPLYNGTAIVVMTTIGILLFKEKLTRRRFAATAIGIAAIIIFGIAK